MTNPSQQQTLAILLKTLQGLHPARLEVFDLLWEVSTGRATIDFDTLMEQEELIQEAVSQAETVADASERVIARCLSLRPVAGLIPLGF